MRFSFFVGLAVLALVGQAFAEDNDVHGSVQVQGSSQGVQTKVNVQVPVSNSQNGQVYVEANHQRNDPFNGKSQHNSYFGVGGRINF